jgi:hypothetical protein
VAGEADELEQWLMARITEEPHLESNLHTQRALQARARHDWRQAAASYLANARLDPFNAPTTCAEAVFYALLDRDPTLAREALAGLEATGSHGAMVKLARRVAEAGLAALDGDRTSAQAGLLSAYAGYRDLGIARKQLMTGVLMATLLDTGDPQVNPLIDEARRIGERLGARPWLSLLDEAERADAGAGSDGSSGIAVRAAPASDGSGGRPAVATEP